MAELHARPPRDQRKRSSGQHFLKSRRFTSQLVDSASLSRRDLVVEVGAGYGRITAELAMRARRVVAVERDAVLATRLIERFASHENVLVVVGDALDLPLPAEPFRVFANPPFGITTALLRKLLDDPAMPLVRADLVVQEGLAVKRTRRLPSNLLNLSWGPWWKLEVTKRIRRTAFEPMPSVDAAVLTIRRRVKPLITSEERSAFLEFLARAFSNAGRIPCPTDLELSAWIREFRRYG